MIRIETTHRFSELPGGDDLASSGDPCRLWFLNEDVFNQQTL